VFPILRRNDDPAQQLKDVLAYIDQHREDDRPLDVVHVGHTPGDDLAAARATVERFASAGATWWFERLTPARYGVDWEDEWPLEQMQARIMQGPPV
jgi:hypothetical protein